MRRNTGTIATTSTTTSIRAATSDTTAIIATAGATRTPDAVCTAAATSAPPWRSAGTDAVGTERSPTAPRRARRPVRSARGRSELVAEVTGYAIGGIDLRRALRELCSARPISFQLVQVRAAQQRRRAHEEGIRREKG